MSEFKFLKFNFGPQHPAAHGVLRLIVELEGETIKWIDPHVGLLHRGTEKLAEFKTFLQIIPYLDRLDYVSMISQEHVFCSCVESFLNSEIDIQIQNIRVVYLELTRILNHLLAITTHALDVGALTPFLWGFEEREKIMEFYERVCGARMHANYIRPLSIASFPSEVLLLDIYNFICRFISRIDEIEDLLTNNRIWNQRLVEIGVILANDALNFGFSGVMLRGSGVLWDLRFNEPYENYYSTIFKIPVGVWGDCYDRFLIRMEEMRQSCLIISQILINLLNKNFKYTPIKTDFKLLNPNRRDMKYTMEALIHHFKYFTENIYIPKGVNYIGLEAPKGEFGVFLESVGLNKPYRCHFRSPGLFHLASINSLVYGYGLADLVAVIGTADLVFGEIDR